MRNWTGTYDPNDFSGGMVYDQDAEEEETTPFEKLEVGNEVECTQKDKTITGYIEQKTKYEILVHSIHGKFWLHDGDYTFLVI